MEACHVEFRTSKVNLMSGLLPNGVRLGMAIELSGAGQLSNAVAIV